MATNNLKNYLLLITVLVLATLACGTLQVGVLTATPVADTQLVEDQQPVIEPVVAEETGDQAGEGTATEPAAEIAPITVTAWLGHIASLPEGSQFDDFVILSPEGTAEFGLTGATPDLEAEIRSLRDAEGPAEYVHLWGALACTTDGIPVEDYNGCQLVVEKMQYGANYSEEEITGWVGTIKGTTFNSGSSYVFELSGDFPMWYSIYASQDQALQAQLESLRDTAAVVQLDAKLLVGVPDVNGSRLEVTHLDVLEPGTQEQPETDLSLDIPGDWPAFVNDRYSYQVRHPMGATISFFGPAGFSADDLPADMSPEQYMDSLLKEYTDRLCVRIEYSLGWIYIAAPPNKEKMLTPCGPTGIGAGEIINKIENIVIGDRVYQAHGTEFILQVSDSAGNIVTGETLDLHGEMFGVELPDGTVIRFGSQPRQDATYQDYLMKTRETLLLIVSTYQALP